ncbi:general secretion pathway protein J [Vibrio xiamenensis]|uniref:Type II secretion system protein J n=1 Tax=Vibrio xiamenensis TaxID=861298 RepID=A0A1G8F3B6_9VIBR|nr:type II secretion system minor pseudopilin GspJ [Vibrio xiamenensis]SDH76509.1 general secretion pathway protein J [Vibrio xiamenensis]
MPANKRQRSQGFTLIEVLVAIAIFASLSVGAYQVLNQVSRSNELSQEKSQRLKELQRAMIILDNDFRQMTARTMRSEGEEPSTKLLLWQEYLLDSDSQGVMFARGGWQNPQQQFPRGEVTKVGYRIKDDVLERVWWRYPDTPAGQESLSRPILTKVKSWSMSFFDGKQWQQEWQQDNTLPKAVDIKLNLEDYGEIERIYLTTGATLTSSADSEEESSSDTSSNSDD